MALLSGLNELDSNTATFSDWLQKTNELIRYMRGDTISGKTSIMSANSLPGGSMTFGNATLFGQMTANAMVILNDGGDSANTLDGADFGGLRGGQWISASNTIVSDTLYVVSNTTFTSESTEVYVNSTYGLIVENTTELRYDVLYIGDGPAGSNTNAQLHWQSSNNQLNFNDDVRATFGGASGTEVFGGTGQYEMFYSAADNRMYTNTDIQDIRSTANLNLITDRFELRTETSGENMMTANLNGEVVLYWDNATRLTTNTYGITVHGDAILEDDLVIFDGNKILMGGDTTYDGTEDLTTYKFQMFTDGSDAFIDAEDRDLYLRVKEGFELTTTGGAVHFVTANTTGENEVALFAAGVERLSTIDSASDADNSPDGVEIYGEANTITLRVQSDAYFDGSAGLNSNEMVWNSSNNALQFTDNTKATFGNDEDLSIYHDGILGQSNIRDDGLGPLVISGTNLRLEATDGTRYISAVDGQDVRYYSPAANTVELTINDAGLQIENDANTNTLRVRSTALLEDDVFFDGTANNALHWDASLDTLNWDDDVKATFGDSGDLQIYHDSNNSFIREQGTGQLNIDGSVVSIRDVTDGNAIATFTDGAGVVLRHNNSTKFETSSSGATLQGTLIADGVTVGDSEIIQLGTTMQLYNDSVDSYINETGAGSLIIQANNFVIEATTGENYIQGTAGGSVRLYFNGDANTKLQTLAGGVLINGQTDTDTLLVSGTSELQNDITITGTVGNVTWDKAADSLRFRDDQKINFGTSQVDLSIFSTSTGNLIDALTGDLTIRQFDDDNDIIIQSDNGSGGVTDYFRADGSTGETKLYHNSSATEKLKTTSTGITVTGTLIADDFSGSGDQITDLNASNINAGTIGDAYLPGEISSNISGTAAQSNTIQMHTSTTPAEFPVVIAASTSGYQDATGDSTFTFNPSTDTLTVENFVATTTASLPSGLTLSGNTAFENIEVSNTATILNLEVTTLEANGVAFTGTGGDVTVQVATVIDSFPIGQTQGYKYFVHGEDLGDNNSGYAVEINVIVTDNNDIYYTRYGEVENNMADVTIVPILASNTTHIDLQATCGSASVPNTHRFKVLKIETRP